MYTVYNSTKNDIKYELGNISNAFSSGLGRALYEFDNDLINRVKINSKEIIEKNKPDVSNNEKSYRRKIKKKIIDN